MRERLVCASGAADRRRLPVAGPPDLRCARPARDGRVAPPRPPHLSRRPRWSACRAGSACWRRAARAASRTPSVCGGRGRCSTCRVRVGKGAGSPAAALRRRSGASWRGSRRPPTCGWPARSGPSADLAVTPLMPAEPARPAVLAARWTRAAASSARSRCCSPTCAASRRFAEGRLPYDTVFVLNRYFAAMGERDRACRRSGRQVHRRRDHGAVRARQRPGAGGAGRPRRSAARMARGPGRAQPRAGGRARRAAAHGHRPASGPRHRRRDGPRPAVSLTAIGDTVNVASRLEALTKELGCQLIVSERLARRAGIDLEGFPLHEVDLRGRAGRLPRASSPMRTSSEPQSDDAVRRWWRWAPEPFGAPSWQTLLVSVSRPARCLRRRSGNRGEEDRGRNPRPALARRLRPRRCGRAAFPAPGWLFRSRPPSSIRPRE